MSQDALLPVLGRCPLCEDRLNNGCLLATYAADDSWPRMLAECPDCSEIVSPV